MSYFNIVEGIRNITLKQMYEIREKQYLEVNFRYANRASSIGLPFSQICGNEFIGEYPNILEKFCSRISLNGIDDWFTKMFVAVNPYQGYPEFNCIIGKIRPKKIFTHEKQNTFMNSEKQVNKVVSGTVQNDRKENSVSSHEFSTREWIMVVIIISLLIPNIYSCIHRKDTIDSNIERKDNIIKSKADPVEKPISTKSNNQSNPDHKKKQQKSTNSKYSKEKTELQNKIEEHKKRIFSLNYMRKGRLSENGFCYELQGKRNISKICNNIHRENVRKEINNYENYNRWYNKLVELYLEYAVLSDKEFLNQKK